MQPTAIKAISPITNPINCPWGQKAFTHYLGSNKELWLDYDACELLKKQASSLPILVDQGDADGFLAEQLKPGNLLDAAKQSNTEITLRMQSGYDHSYYFIQSFVNEHLDFHCTHLFS